MTKAAQILDELTARAEQVVFCDDTDIAGGGGNKIAHDLRILCAVSMPSERYEAAATKLKAMLNDLGQDEFHATEIVNPKNPSLWRKVSIQQRIDAFRFIGGVLTNLPARLYCAYVTRLQYKELRRDAQKLGSVNVGYKAGLKRVFLRCLFERLCNTPGHTAIILDQDTPFSAPIIEDYPEGSFLVGNGPIVADSRSVLGLQLADMAAYSIQRFKQRRDAIVGGDGKPFDQIAMGVIAAFEGRCENLLDSIPEGTSHVDRA